MSVKKVTEKRTIQIQMGWDARPFKDQFPELSDKDGERLDRLNKAIMDLGINQLITEAQHVAIVHKKFPALVFKILRASPNFKF